MSSTYRRADEDFDGYRCPSNINRPRARNVQRQLCSLEQTEQARRRCELDADVDRAKHELHAAQVERWNEEKRVHDSRMQQLAAQRKAAADQEYRESLSALSKMHNHLYKTDPDSDSFQNKR